MEQPSEEDLVEMDKQVANAESLAFFLPGVVSGLTKAIRSSMVTSKRPVTTATYKSVGAAGSTGALEESLRCLAELLVLVLADSRNRSCLSEMDPAPSEPGDIVDQVEAALESLQVVLHKEDTRKSMESLKEDVPGNSNSRDLSVAGAAPHPKKVFKEKVPISGVIIQTQGVPCLLTG